MKAFLLELGKFIIILEVMFFCGLGLWVFIADPTVTSWAIPLFVGCAILAFIFAGVTRLSTD